MMLRDEFKKLCLNRHSIREYSNKEVTDEDIDFIYRMARTAPSAGGLQAWNCHLAKDIVNKEKICEAAYNQTFILEANAIIIFNAIPNVSGRKYYARGRQLYCIQDATIACSFAMLAAESLGLSTCWVGAFNEEPIKKIYNIDTESKIVALLTIGYTKEKFII